MTQPFDFKYPFLCEGTITWVAEEICDDTRELTKTIFRSEREVVLETATDDCRYTITLTSVDGFSFSGSFQVDDGKGFQNSGTVQVSLYQNKSNFILYGKWIENGDQFHVICRFSAAREI